MIHVPHLVIVAGTGRKAGKTTVACRIIETFKKRNLTAVKISSHFHEPQNHLMMVERNECFSIWEECSRDAEKDSSRFLAAGATRSFYIQTRRECTSIAFNRLLELLPYISPIVCESPSLAKDIIPGALIVVSGDKESSSGLGKDLSYLEGRKFFLITTADVDAGSSIPLVLNDSGFSIT